MSRLALVKRCVCVLMALALAGPAAAEQIHSPTVHTLNERVHKPALRPVSTVLRTGRVFTQCRSTRGIPASASLTTWAYVDGRPLHGANARGALSQYFAGRGVLVDVFARSTTSPVCVRAVAWRRVRLRVTFALS